MNVASLFDGYSTGHIACDRAKLKVDKYYSSEIKKDAIIITQHNYPETIQLGNVMDIDFKKLDNIDLLLGGSPCQDLSQANKNRDGLEGNKSSLFYQFVRALDEIKPKYFLFENVEMPAKDFAIISNALGTKPININSCLVSAQNRNRYYWTNIGDSTIDLFGQRTCAIPQPRDKHILLQDILTSGYTDMVKARCLLESDSRPLRNIDKMLYRYYEKGFTTLVFEDKYNKRTCRYLNQIELERLQTLPEGYTSIIPRDRAAGCIGDGWTVDVITHILKYLK